MNLRQLQYAVMLSEARSFSQVAEELSISQPALSKQIINLENELGIKLFDRNTSPLTLTPAGEFFVSKAEEILFQEDVLLKTLDRYRTGDKGRLAIGISPFRSLYIMPALVTKLKERYPDLHISLHEHGRTRLHKELLEGLYDFAITNLPIDESKLEAHPLEQDRLVLAVPQQYLSLLPADSDASQHTTISLKDCEHLPFIVLSKEQELRKLFNHLCKVHRVQPEIFVEVVGVTTAWTMVQNGCGATILPMQFIKNSRLSDDVALFELESDSFIRQPAIVTRRGQFISEYARYAIELLSSGDT